MGRPPATALRRDLHGRLNVNVAPTVRREAAQLATLLSYTFTAYVEAAIREKNSRERRRAGPLVSTQKGITP